MKNQYAGDIGDYGKFAMLRVLAEAGFSVGVNWYLTYDDGSTDGQHISYLSKPCTTPDKELFQKLALVVNEMGKSVASL